MQYIPGLAVLLALLAVLVLFLWRLDAAHTARLLEGRGFLLLSTLLISGLLLVTNLFRQEAWTADVLKVLLGVVVGLGASMAEKRAAKEPGSSIDTSRSTFGDYAKIAGRDINETIERMESQISQIRDSVIHQHASSAGQIGSAGEGPDQEYLLNTVYERGMADAVQAAQRVTQRWHAEGWALRSISSDYQGMDGLVLLFARPAQGEPGSFRFFHSSSMNEERPRQSR